MDIQKEDLKALVDELITAENTLTQAKADHKHVCESALNAYNVSKKDIPKVKAIVKAKIGDGLDALRSETDSLLDAIDILGE